MRGTTVLLDTSVFLLLYEGVDIFERISDVLLTKCRYVTLSSVVEELIRLSQVSHGRRGRAARLALSAIPKYVEVIDVVSRGSADEDIVNYVSKHRDIYVATADRGLKERLMGMGIKVIFYRRSKRGFEVI